MKISVLHDSGQMPCSNKDATSNKCIATSNKCNLCGGFGGVVHHGAQLGLQPDWRTTRASNQLTNPLKALATPKSVNTVHYFCKHYSLSLFHSTNCQAEVCQYLRFSTPDHKSPKSPTIQNVQMMFHYTFFLFCAAYLLVLHIILYVYIGLEGYLLHETRT